MIVRHLRIENFRGIETLEAGFADDQRTICFVGPGDSGKSSLLDAIELALSPNWSAPVDDADFFNCEIGRTIRIFVSVGECPSELLTDAKFGFWLRGVDSAGNLHDDPLESDEPVLTVLLEVDSTLEPKWRVYKDAKAGEEHRISAADRSKLGLNRTGAIQDLHLRWARGSAFTKLGNLGSESAVISNAHRQARASSFAALEGTLDDTLSRAKEHIARIAAGAIGDPKIGLDPAHKRFGASLVLHDGQIPATKFGTGSRRLASTALQLAGTDDQSVVVVDEVEHGLEPHRLVHLLDTFARRGSAKQGQVFLTTHSPQVVQHLDCTDLTIVGVNGTSTTLSRVPRDLAGLDAANQKAVRSGPSALLAKRVIVCEGATEVGMLRALARYWASKDAGDKSFALRGVAFLDGGGEQAPGRARCFAELGFPCLLWIDSDKVDNEKKAFDLKVSEADSAGVHVIRSSDGNSIENELLEAVKPEFLAELVTLILELPDGATELQQILDAVGARLGNASLSGGDPQGWIAQSSTSLDEVRAAIASAANSGAWFKSESKAQLLVEATASKRIRLEKDSSLVASFRALREFAFSTSNG